MNLAASSGVFAFSWVTWRPGSYRLQASTDMKTWTDLMTNGPFTCMTNLTQDINPQGFDARFFRLRVQ